MIRLTMEQIAAIYRAAKAVTSLQDELDRCEDAQATVGDRVIRIPKALIAAEIRRQRDTAALALVALGVELAPPEAQPLAAAVPSISTSDLDSAFSEFKAETSGEASAKSAGAPIAIGSAAFVSRCELQQRGIL